jgi:hypothetical protein
MLFDLGLGPEYRTTSIDGALVPKSEPNELVKHPRAEAEHSSASLPSRSQRPRARGAPRAEAEHSSGPCHLLDCKPSDVERFVGMLNT